MKDTTWLQLKKDMRTKITLSLRTWTGMTWRAVLANQNDKHLKCKACTA